ncbi:MAG: hypothetical protein ACHQ2Y_09795 [Candidatus Lutacidiplasmatales archaeon]
MPKDPIDQAVADTKRAAKELANATARLSGHLLTKAGTLAQDAPGVAKEVGDRVAKELEAAAREVERILKELE